MNSVRPSVRRVPRQPSEIKRVTYQDPVQKDLDIQCFDTDFIRDYMSPEHFLGPQRLDFHLLLLFTAGRGIHTVDTVRYLVSRGTLLTVRPGQIQEWDNINWPHAKMLTFKPSFLPSRPGRRDDVDDVVPPPSKWPVHLSLSNPEYALVERSLDEIRREMLVSEGRPVSLSLLLHLLCVLLIRVTRMAGTPAPLEEGEESKELYHSFRREVERHFRDTRSVIGYTVRLGCSEKTLYRAVVTSVGLTPKEIIDERVLLEAQRLLVHTKWPPKQIAAELGFSEPTNFTKFFRRVTGQTPSQFRKNYTL